MCVGGGISIITIQFVITEIKLCYLFTEKIIILFIVLKNQLFYFV